MSLAIENISPTTEKEGKSLLAEKVYYQAKTLDQQFEILVTAFKKCGNKATLKQLNREMPEFTHHNIYWLLDLWSGHPHTYFDFGRIIKRYPVTQTVDSVGRVQHHTKNTLPYFQIIEHKKDVSNQSQKIEPIWIYIPSDHPLARSSTIDEYIRQRPFLEEILLNGRVSDNRY